MTQEYKFWNGRKEGVSVNWWSGWTEIFYTKTVWKWTDIRKVANELGVQYILKF